MPWLRYIIPNLSGYLGLREMFDELRFWFENVVKEHKRTFDENNMRLRKIGTLILQPNFLNYLPGFFNLRFFKNQCGHSGILSTSSFWK